VSLIPAALTPDAETWHHIREILLPKALRNTLMLMFVVSLGAGTLGVGFAYLTTRFHFFGSRVLGAMVPVGVAFPGYVLAFIFIDIFDYSGPVQSQMRQLGWEASGSVRNFWGLSLVLILALMPYVYLLSRLGFERQGGRLREVAQTLGIGSFRTFIKIEIPANMPWILSGLVLVNMEIVSDFGTVSAFNFETFTFLIYRAWFDLFSWSVASLLSLVSILLVVAMLIWQSVSQSRKRFYEMGLTSSHPSPAKLTGWRSWILTFIFLSFLALSVFLPLGRLIFWTLSQAVNWEQLFSLASSTLIISAIAVAMALVMCLLLTLNERDFGVSVFSRASLLGYAVPGTILGVGALMLRSHLGFDSLESATITLGLIVLAYSLSVRFLNVMAQPLQTSLKRVPHSVDQAAELLGASRWSLFRKIRWPLMAPAVVGGCAFTFIEVIKEMPMTLIMRPIGWDTFSVKVYEFTSEGEWEMAATPALCIVVFAVLPSLVFGRSLKGAERNTR